MSEIERVMKKACGGRMQSGTVETMATILLKRCEIVAKLASAIAAKNGRRMITQDDVLAASIEAYADKLEEQVALFEYQLREAKVEREWVLGETHRPRQEDESQ